MNIKSIIGAVLAIGVWCGLGAGCATEKENKAGLEAKAKVTRAEAERIALSRVPGGTIKEGGIEKEHGKVIWSFDIAAPGTTEITEVAVDSMTGQVLALDKETPEKEAKEKQEKE